MWSAPSSIHFCWPAQFQHKILFVCIFNFTACSTDASGQPRLQHSLSSKIIDAPEYVIFFLLAIAIFYDNNSGCLLGQVCLSAFSPPRIELSKAPAAGSRPVSWSRNPGCISLKTLSYHHHSKDWYKFLFSTVEVFNKLRLLSEMKFQYCRIYLLIVYHLYFSLPAFGRALLVSWEILETLFKIGIFRADMGK